jgi:hypothetical protein
LKSVIDPKEPTVYATALAFRDGVRQEIVTATSQVPYLAEFSAQPSEIVLSLDGRRLGGTKRLDLSQVSCVDVKRANVEFRLLFHPGNMSSERAKLFENMFCDFTKMATFQDLSKYLHAGGHFASALAFTFQVGSEPRLPQTLLITIPDHATLDMAYPDPSNPGPQRFAWRGKSAEVQTIAIALDQKVREVKLRVLSAFAITDRLPGTITLSFFGPLEEDEFWRDYGIPDDSRITVTESKQVQRLFRFHFGTDV